jgi:hypothetical protein
MPASHPLSRRLLWRPAFVALPTAYVLYRVSTHRLSGARIGGLVCSAIWFPLSVYNLITKHRFLDWLYSPD